MTWELIPFYSYFHCSYFLTHPLGNNLNVFNVHLFICVCFCKMCIFMHRFLTNEYLHILVLPSVILLRFIHIETLKCVYPICFLEWLPNTSQCASTIFYLYTFLVMDIQIASNFPAPHIKL